jgi:hypothetical protein
MMLPASQETRLVPVPRFPWVRPVLFCAGVLRAGPSCREHRRPGPKTPTCLPKASTLGAGEGNRTPTTSLEGWGSTIELHPRLTHCSKPGAVESSPAGCGAAWLARVLWEHEVAGSSPATPTVQGSRPEPDQRRDRFQPWPSDVPTIHVSASASALRRPRVESPDGWRPPWRKPGSTA